MNIKISENIKRLRKAKKITQEGLAEIFNVTPAAVSKWENNETYPDITLLFPLSHFFGVSIDELMGYEVGSIITADVFSAGDLVDVIGTTKGKGFAGVIKTYGHSIGPKGHGSGSHRVIGSMATNGRTNNRVHPGKKMPGHHTVLSKTILNLEVVAVDAENNALLIKGAIPGPKKGLVTVRTAIKNVKKPTAKTLVDYTVSEAE